MSFYFPIFLTWAFAIVQTYLSKFGLLMYSMLTASLFSGIIYFFFSDYDFIAYLILGNFFFYLMAVATFFTRSKY